MRIRLAVGTISVLLLPCFAASAPLRAEVVSYPAAGETVTETSTSGVAAETTSETQQANETQQETTTEAAGATASVAGGGNSGTGGVVTLPNTGGAPLAAEALLGALLAALGAALVKPREILKRLFR